MNHFFTILLIFTAMATSAHAMGGDKVYQFLSLPASTEEATLGGSNVSTFGGDIMQTGGNPALLPLCPDKSIGLEYANHIDGAHQGALRYGMQIDSLSWWGAGMGFQHFGQMDGYDIYDTPTGSFSASDLVVSALYVRRLARGLSLGMALKPIYSHIEDYSSWGLAIDVGAHYYMPKHLFSAGLVIRDLGVQFTPYDDERGSLPLDVQIGLTKQLAHAPFRFSLTYVKLNDWDFDYVKQGSLYNSDGTTQSEYKRHVGWGDMLLRHMIVGMEFVPSRNFTLMASYNHRRHKEFDMENAGGAAGFSFGGRLHVYKFSLGISYSIYGPGGNVLGLNLSSSIDAFKKK